MKIFHQDDANGKLTVDVTAKGDGGIEVFFHDIGQAARQMTGDSEYERALTIGPDQVAALAMHLLAERFEGDIQAQSKIEVYCQERGIETSAWSF